MQFPGTATSLFLGRTSADWAWPMSEQTENKVKDRQAASIKTAPVLSIAGAANLGGFLPAPRGANAGSNGSTRATKVGSKGKAPAVGHTKCYASRYRRAAPARLRPIPAAWLDLKVKK